MNCDFKRGDLVMTTDLIERSMGPWVFLHCVGQESKSHYDIGQFAILISIDNSSSVNVSLKSLTKVGNINNICNLATILA